MSNRHPYDLDEPPAVGLPPDLDDAFEILRLELLRYKLGGFRTCEMAVLHGRIEFFRELLSIRIDEFGFAQTRTDFPDKRKHPEP